MIDADSQVLGRLSSEAAKLLRGKHKTDFTPHVDCGDNVIIVNAEKINLTGKKWTGKKYISHTGYPGGQKEVAAVDIMRKFPTRLVEKAVKGMLPKSRLGSELFRNLFVYEGAEHPHEAQQPKEYKIK